MTRALLSAGLALAVFGAYSNHFQNGFHFDDSHSIGSNVYIEDLRNVPRFYTDATTFSPIPVLQTYRPVISTSLAVDYWLGQGRNPFYFHLSTFFWYIVQLVLMVFLFRRVMDQSWTPAGADPQLSNRGANFWTALVAAAAYGLHPANAETVNYIIQRADLYVALGTIASLLWFAAYPGQRRRGWYLLPAAAAFLSKATALCYPMFLLAYVFLFEQGADRRKWGAAMRACLPAFLVTAAAAAFTARMTPAAYDPGGASAWLYRLTQPWVGLRYFKSFFLPTELSADNDWDYVSGAFSGQALAGYLFVAILLAIAVYTARPRGAGADARPVSFGIWWFLIAMLPTSLMPLADVSNDHRMFFPFVGLALSVVWGLRLLAEKMPVWKSVAMRRGAVAGLVLVLAAEAAGTRERNRVWRTEESLWRDVTVKSPRNIRGVLAYSQILLGRGDHAAAVPYLERAERMNPESPEVQEYLGTAYGGVGREQDAVRRFRRAIDLAPGSADPYFYYGQWLKTAGRLTEAQSLLEKALQIDRVHISSRYVLLEVFSAQKNRPAFDALAEETLRLAQNNEMVRRYVEERVNAERRGEVAAPGPGIDGSSPEALLHESAGLCRAGKFDECIAAARKALALRPDYAEAYNNIAASYIALKRWDEGIRAATEAVRLKPDFELAKKNLQRALAGAGGRAGPAGGR